MIHLKGTVRSLKNEFKNNQLKSICPDAKYVPELFEADLTSSQGWDAAVEDCQYILHVASPFPSKEPDDRNELIRPAVDGTLYVLRAAAAATVQPRRVVLTSSIASIVYGTNIDSKVYTEDDWTVVDDPKYPITGYYESKVRAERAAWDFMKTLPEDKKFELTTVNPSLVVGQLLVPSDSASISIISNLLLGKTSALPNFYMDLISVHDVAKIHLLAMTHPDAPGKRFLCHATQMKFKDIAQVLYNEFHDKGYKPTLTSVPNFVISIMGFFDSKV